MVMAAERMVLQELEHRDMRMPVKCCTIIAWSCASLRVFRNSLFSALARLATVNIEQCQSYEMTNIMWAFGELCKSRRQLGKDLKDELHKLLEATCRIFALRPFGWKLQAGTEAVWPNTFEVRGPLKNLKDKCCIESSLKLKRGLWSFGLSLFMEIHVLETGSLWSASRVCNSRKHPKP